MIYFVRHGSTDWNDNKNEKGERDPKCQGIIDIPLNDRGRAQAKETKEALRGIKFARVICSPLTRARQTCEILCDDKSKIEIDERLIERDFGEFEGLTRHEFDFIGFWNDKTRAKYKRAETIKEVRKRIYSLLKELEEYKDENVLLVSHGGVGCVLMSFFYGIPSDGNYLSFEVPNGKPLIVDNQLIKEK